MVTIRKDSLASGFASLVSIYSGLKPLCSLPKNSWEPTFIYTKRGNASSAANHRVQYMTS